MGMLSEQDIYLFREGTHATLYERLGCHFFSPDAEDGAHLAVWAPNARAVSVIGAATPQAAGLPSLKLRQNIEWVEKETIRRALEGARGVKKDAAELMGISQRALSYYLAKYRID